MPRYNFVVTLTYTQTVTANNKENAVLKLKEGFVETHSIDITDNEIQLEGGSK